MRTTTLLLSSLVVGMIQLAGSSSAQAEVLFNDFVPFTDVFEFCDDVVAVEGELHVKVSLTFDAEGNAHQHLLFHPTAVEGVSLIDGTEFIGTGANSQSLQLSLPEGDGTRQVASTVILVGDDGRVYIFLAIAELTFENFAVVNVTFRVGEVICL